MNVVEYKVKLVICSLKWKYFTNLLNCSAADSPSWLAVLLSPLSGYFVQDAGDIILTGHARASWEFLIHHALVRKRAFDHASFFLIFIKVARLVQITSESDDQEEVNIKVNFVTLV